MAVATYTQRPTTASNQNRMAMQDLNQQNQVSNAAWKPQNYTPNYGQQQRNPFANSAPSAQRPPSGPYNPNPPSQQSPYQTQQTQYTPSSPNPWTPQTPTAPEFTPYTPATTQNWPNPNTGGAETPWTSANFNTQALRDQYTAYMQATLPYLQYQQNSQQYTQDFNEAARRWDTQSQWQQSMDQYNMGLTGRQQEMAEWQAQEAANQWASQFGWQQENDRFGQDLANRQFGLSEREQQANQWYQQQQVQLAGQAQEIERAYNEGRLSNDQRQIALAELTQQQNDAHRRLELEQQMGWAREQQANQLGFGREELAATQQYRQMQQELARAQMAQELQMQQAQIEAQRQNAILQATGRAAGQAPNARWMRRF